MKVSKNGSGLMTLASGQSSPFSVAPDATSIYWTNIGDGTIMKPSKDGDKAQW